MFAIAAGDIVNGSSDGWKTSLGAGANPRITTAAGNHNSLWSINGRGESVGGRVLPDEI